jgi:hypothetical protein
MVAIFWIGRKPSCEVSMASASQKPEMMVELIGRGFVPVATVFHLLLAKRHSSSRCANTETSIRPKRDDFLWQGCQKQHDTNTKKDDIFVQEFPGEVPRYWVCGYAPFDDTGCREEKRPRNRKRTNSHQ